jgi:hypothetical protein
MLDSMGLQTAGRSDRSRNAEIIRTKAGAR